MFLLKNFKAKPLFGLEISQQEVSLLRLNRVKNEIYLEKLGSSTIPQGLLIEGKLNAESLRAALVSLIEQAQIAGHSVALAIPMASVITKRIKLNAELSDKDHAAEITSNLNRYAPGMTDWYVDLAKVKPDEILLFAISHEQLNEYVSVVNQAGLQVKIIDIDAFIFARALGYFQAMQASKVLSWWSYWRGKQKQRFLSMLFSGILFAFIFLSSWHVCLSHCISRENIHLHALEQQLSRLNFQTEVIQQWRDDSERFKVVLEKMQHINQNQSEMLKFFSHISAAPSEMVFIDMINLSGKIILSAKNASSDVFTTFLKNFPEAQLIEIQNQPGVPLIKFQFRVVQDEKWIKSS